MAAGRETQLRGLDLGFRTQGLVGGNDSRLLGMRPNYGEQDLGYGVRGPGCGE